VNETEGEQMREKNLDSELVPHLNFIYFIPPSNSMLQYPSFILRNNMRKAHTHSHKKNGNEN